jgi:hypothetical protein
LQLKALWRCTLRRCCSSERCGAANHDNTATCGAMTLQIVVLRHCGATTRFVA